MTVKASTIYIRMSTASSQNHLTFEFHDQQSASVKGEYSIYDNSACHLILKNGHLAMWVACSIRRC